MRSVRSVLATLTAPVLWRRWAYLILGGALLMPYMMAGQVVAALLERNGVMGDPLAAAQVRIFVAVLPVVALSALVLPVRGLERTTARELLVAPLPDLAAHPMSRSLRDRARVASWFTLHLAVGGLVSGLTLALVPFAVWLWTLPFVGDAAGMIGTADGLGPGWTAAWALPAGVAVLVGLAVLAGGTGALLARAAPAALGPTPADRRAELERRTARLAERDRLARELHDSVGHALSVVAVQAGAAAHVLDRDPTFARQALTAIGESARRALEDLDHVLGLLRQEQPPGRAPQPTLADLDTLLQQTRATGLQIDARVEMDPEAIPAAVSREAYRIVQEGLTNILRHAGRVPVSLRVTGDENRLELELSNPAPPGPAGPTAAGRGGGRGLAGIRERVGVLRGEMSAGAQDGRWCLRVSVPW